MFNPIYDPLSRGAHPLRLMCLIFASLRIIPYPSFPSTHRTLIRTLINRYGRTYIRTRGNRHGKFASLTVFRTSS